MRKKKKTLIPTFSREREKGFGGAGPFFFTLSRSREGEGLFLLRRQNTERGAPPIICARTSGIGGPP
jgi:hypothetical protein